MTTTSKFFGLRDDNGNGEQICANDMAEALKIAKDMAAPGRSIRVAAQNDDGDEIGEVYWVCGD